MPLGCSLGPCHLILASSDMTSVHIATNLLRALDVLLEEENVSRAAARLHLTQSAMSRSLARLRQLFGDELLLRTGRGMRPTARARAPATAPRRGGRSRSTGLRVAPVRAGQCPAPLPGRGGGLRPRRPARPSSERSPPGARARLGLLPAPRPRTGPWRAAISISRSSRGAPAAPAWCGARCWRSATPVSSGADTVCGISTGRNSPTSSTWWRPGAAPAASSTRRSPPRGPTAGRGAVAQLSPAATRARGHPAHRSRAPPDRPAPGHHPPAESARAAGAGARLRPLPGLARDPPPRPRAPLAARPRAARGPKLGDAGP